MNKKVVDKENIYLMNCMSLQLHLMEILEDKVNPQFLLCLFSHSCDIPLANLVAKSLAWPGNVPKQTLNLF